MDLSKINPLNLGALVAGGLTIILSFIPSYVTASIDSDIAGVNFSSGTSAWDSFAVLGVLLLVAATAAIAVKVFAPQVIPAGVPINLAAAGAAGLGTLLLILRAFTYSGGFGVDVGPGWSGYAIFITSIALTVFAALGFKDSGEKLPDFNNNGGGQPPAGPTPPAPPAGPPAP
ncbi:MAG: hypothetical protein P1U38_01150 [Aeromicrobium sp.]|uniref:hypothetical protein n=1 Tax=Aeromicrobium sp. TaxID=1871063 RepID=UPI00260272E4|nr:hypothetical protein [Aeromicrobium sp.]MDF1703360.1 hypothetical protein [Aeromicrobium sp.]